MGLQDLGHSFEKQGAGILLSYGRCSLDTLVPYAPFSLFTFLLFEGRRSLVLLRLGDLKTSLEYLCRRHVERAP